MNVTYSDKAKQAPHLALLQQATDLLAEIAGRSAPLVTVAWDQTEDARQRPVYTLRISDWTGEVSAPFTPAELRSTRQLRSRLNWLFGDLLQVRSHKLLQELTEGGSQRGA